MFSVGLFYVSLGVLLAIFGFRWLENQELGDNNRYFARTRVRIDNYSLIVRTFLQRHFSLRSLTYYSALVYQTCAHYIARVVAYVGHVLEHRARRVVHRTSRRPRSEHYLAADAARPHVDSGEVEK